MLTMGLMSRNPVLEKILTVIGNMPSSTVVLTGMVIGAATSWAGWHSGKRPVTPAVGTAAQPA